MKLHGFCFRTYFIFPFFLPLIVSLSCIERDNPWDPYNGCHPVEELPVLRERYRQSLDSILVRIQPLSDWVDSTEQSFFNRRDRNEEAFSRNIKIDDTVCAYRTYNDSIIAAYNEHLDCSQVGEPKNIIQRLSGMLPVSSIGDHIEERVTSLDMLHMRADSVIAEARSKCPKNDVLSPVLVDSVTTLFDSLHTSWQTFDVTVKRYQEWVLDTNAIIDSVNSAWQSLNESINGFILFCRYDPLTDTAEMQTAIDSAVAGDSIIIASGEFHINDFLLFEQGSDSAWIYFIGDPTQRTEIHSARVEVSGCSNIRFENMVFSEMGNGNGVQLLSGTDSVTFINCIFTDDTSYGLNANDCPDLHLHLENCRFTFNGKADADDIASRGGIRISRSGKITATNILVAQNFGHGIDIVESNISITNGTISDNVLDGIQFTSPAANRDTLIATSTLFTFNGRNGITRNDENTIQDVFIKDRDNYFFGNTQKPLEANSITIEANTPISSADPHFIDRDDGDYRIGESSELYTTGIGFQYP